MQRQYDQDPVNAPRMAPPVDAGNSFLQHESAKWSRVIGIVVIVCGAMGTLGGVVGIVGQINHGKLRMWVVEEQRVAYDVDMNWQVWIYAEQAMRLAAGVFAIVAGTKLIKRLGSSMHLLRAWSVFKLILVVASVAIGYRIAQEKIGVALDDPRYQSAGMTEGFMKTIAQLTMGCITLWGLALPVFLLVWFARDRIKAEVATWWDDGITN
ncbi:MAG: hypothetical protein H6817_07050 [Phycisphaerales bacterium]|nr:hypothetical protein [Phycisphaerales bacterium]